MSTRTDTLPLQATLSGTSPTLESVSFLEDLFEQFRRDPASVPADYRGYFEQLQQGGSRPLPGTVPHVVASADVKELRLRELVEAYRVYGHRQAWLDPLSPQPPAPRPELDPARYGFGAEDLDTSFALGGLLGLERATLREVIARLQATYCRYIGVELSHIEQPQVRRWLTEQMERSQNRIALSRAQQLRLLERLTDAEVFERFLGTKFLKEKRFSLEGAESFIPLLDLVIEDAAERGVREVAIGMAHRGRLNVLANIMGKPASEIFRGFLKLDADAREAQGSGDVKYHLGYSADYTTQAGHRMHLALAFNPSHLEAIDPVIEGRVRALQDRLADKDRTVCLPLLVHGDASVAGQGIVAECLNYSQLPGYTTGGTIHVVINNQVGFTTGPSEARSGQYATGIARMLDIPIFHVNGEDPESVAQVVRLAVEFRQRFHQDVFIDLYCYRKHGHNEGDEPSFTQPVMYQAISQRPSVRDNYVQHLLQAGVVTQEDAERIAQRRRDQLEVQLEESRSGQRKHANLLGDVWRRYRGGKDSETPEEPTGLARSELEPLARKLVELPPGFEPHPTLQKFVLKQRLEMAEGKRPFDWGGAENLAFASLVTQGVRVRLTGQDARRGTFSHRHGFYFDHTSAAPYSPLQHLSPDQAPIEIYNSPLSEFGIMGYEYGYSLDAPDALVMWEAQFGDFVNEAQVILDQFLSSAEDKWQRLSGLVLLLPHGFEGQGPEHSSARLERFLQNSAEDNWQVCNFTTPANYFHALRRQALRAWRKPMVVMTPKSLLRHASAVSSYEDLAGGFQKVIGDTTASAERVRRVLLCSGKVYYDLAQRRADRKLEDTAIVRVEQLHPFPVKELEQELAKYGRIERLAWVQEEPKNMGAWFYVKGHDFLEQVKRGALPALPELECVARPASASPATGFAKAHEIEQSRLLDEAFGDEAPARVAAGAGR